MKVPFKKDGSVRVRGAREHNLRDVDVDIPRDSLVVFTGVSGSGKSSLAFGTLYAEAQRRYLESVSPYARRLFHQLTVPAVDSIDGLPPAVALQQQRGAPTTRSSVGSVTTLSNLLRMLYSRAGDYPRNQPLLYAESFSPNTAEGACTKCHGLGRVYEVTADRLAVLRDADAIVREELSRAGLDRRIWQCPVVLLADVRSVGVQGDGRTYGHPVVLRPVTSEDAMTADWARVPEDVLAHISTRITNEVPQINRVVLDVTSKPPGTIEWE